MATKKRKPTSRPEQFPSLDPALIQEIGLTLYGRHWQTELADAVGRSPRMVAYWLRDPARRAPAALLLDFDEVIEEKISELTQMQTRLGKLAKKLGVNQ